MWHYTVGRNKRKYSKKVVRLITSIKEYESCRQKFIENRILMLTSLYVLEVFLLRKEVQGTSEAKFCDS
jgi:hypothetical protein